MLVPEVAQGAAADLRPLRAACDGAILALLALDPDHIVVLGDGPADRYWDHHAGGTLEPYGVNIHAGGASDDLPLSLTIGAWLLDRNGWHGSRAYATGEVDPKGRTALLVMADGSAKRTTEAPGYLDERAEGFDAAIAAALATGDADALLGIDDALAAELWCGGAGPLKLLGSAATAHDAPIEAQLRYDEAPFGVGYWVATWTFG